MDTDPRTVIERWTEIWTAVRWSTSLNSSQIRAYDTLPGTS